VYLTGTSDAREDGKDVWTFGGRENERLWKMLNFWKEEVGCKGTQSL